MIDLVEKAATKFCLFANATLQFS